MADLLSNIDAIREGLHDLELQGISKLGPLHEGLSEEWITLELPSGFSSRTKVIRPKTSGSDDARRPLIVLFYGGGFAAGTPDSEPIHTPAAWPHEAKSALTRKGN
jgi:acetyl esterase/lipase